MDPGAKGTNAWKSIFLFFFFTNHDRGRLWVIWEVNPFICRTETVIKMFQVLAQVVRAGFFWWRPFLEDSIEQMSGRQLPIIRHMLCFWFIQADELKASFPDRAFLLPTDEAFIEVQLCKKHQQLHRHLMWRHLEMLPRFTFNVLVWWNLDVSCGNFKYFFSLLLDTILIRQPPASWQPVFVNGEFCFDQITLFSITAKKDVLVKITLQPQLKICDDDENVRTASRFEIIKGGFILVHWQFKLHLANSPQTSW